jgi:formylglycine-generating enzyme required for sulfatase activity
MFDTLGNVYAWCQERYQEYPRFSKGVIEDKEDINIFNIIESRVLRGGSFVYLASIVRCAYRHSTLPSDRNLSFGFRPARTYR